MQVILIFLLCLFLLQVLFIVFSHGSLRFTPYKLAKKIVDETEKQFSADIKKWD